MPRPIFFFKFVFATQIFLFFLISRKQTNFGVPREGTILLSVPQVELCCPLGQFLSFGLALLSFSGSLKLRFSFTRKTQKGQPLGQKLSRGTTKLNLRDTKQYCTLPRDTKICLFPLEKKKKIEQQKKICKKNWPWQKKVCKKMKKTMKKWIRGPKILSRWSFPFSRSQLPIKEPFQMAILA